jgi:hypothetical protein
MLSLLRPSPETISGEGLVVKLSYCLSTGR